MSYESTAEPIKIGYLMDFKLPPGFPEELFASFTQTFDLIFEEAVQQGLMDRPVQMIYREVEGLPKGSVKAVIDAYAELVDEGCLVVFGPNITDNCVPLREAIEERFRVPAISVTGTDDWLGEWTFAFPQGSMTDEPIFLADLIGKRGLAEIGVLVEQSLIGESYLKNLRSACRRKGIRIVAEVSIAQTAQDINAAVQTLHEAKSEAIVHLGFGFGIVFINPALEAIGWDPPRFTTTAWQNAWVNPIMWNAFMGWTGVDQYDEANQIGQDFLDSYAKKYDGSRPEFCVTVVNRDVAATLVRAFTDAHPLSPRGVKEALERVKMMPAASGAPGTRVSFGKWTRRAWMGAGYLVARTLDADGVNLTSSYGVGASARYVADDAFDPIWEELDRRGALVFIHGDQTPSSTPYPSPLLPIPVAEVPNETYKAAAHLVTSGKKRRFSNVRIILSHAGGSTPFLASRVAVLSRHQGCELTPDEIIEDFRGFYYETALAGFRTNLVALEDFVEPDRILFGSDFPAVSVEMAQWYTRNVDEYFAQRPDQLKQVMRGNALALLPRLRDAVR